MSYPVIKVARNLSILILLCSFSYVQAQHSKVQLADPPYHGTIFIDPDIVTEVDSSSFISAEFTGQGMREMYDRRVNAWITVNALLFDATFTDGSSVEVQVNPEFRTETAARVHVEKYLPSIGQLPVSLRALLETVWIHRGKEAFGGGNNNILIHTEMGDEYIRDGILEETILHEAAHTSLDPIYTYHQDWTNAQQNDPTFISTYARDNPFREDIAESIVPYIAVRYRSDRISSSMRELIELSIPNRIEFFDSLAMDMYPLVTTTTSNEFEWKDSPRGIRLLQNYPNPFNPSTVIPYSLSESGPITVRVYNSRGVQVAELFNGYQTYGNHEITWHAKEFASGIYFYQLSSQAGIETQKMILLK